MKFEKRDLAESLKKSLAKDYVREDVERYASYCHKLLVQVNRDGVPKNAWMQHKNITVDYLDTLFRSVHKEGLVFDGEDVALTNLGINYNYQAWKRKMLNIYPESIIDLQLTYKGDVIDFRKENGKVLYTHKMNDPFNHTDANIIGGYMVIKNKRGEFINLLSKVEIEKRRAVAKTDYIWKAWFAKMCLKTVARDGFSFHFKDDFKGMLVVDNDLSELEEVAKPPEIDVLRGKITDLFEVYQGEDLEDIRNLCNQKHTSKEFTVEFAKNIIDQLGG